MKSLLPAFLALCSLCAAQTAAPAPVPAAATAPAPAPEPDAEHLAAAKDLMTNMHFDDTAQKVIDAQRQGMVARIQQVASMMPAGSATPAEIDGYKKSMIEAWAAAVHTGDISAEMAKVYAKLFTVPQLQTMSDFYKSDAGKALITKTIELQQQSQAILGGHLNAAMPALQKIDQDFRSAHPAKPAAAAPTAPSAPVAPAAPKAP